MWCKTFQKKSIKTKLEVLDKQAMRVKTSKVDTVIMKMQYDQSI